MFVDIELWNGYSSQDVYEATDRREAIRKIIKMIRKKAGGVNRLKDNYRVTATVIEDDEFFSAWVDVSYDFYGWREQRMFFTTREGILHREDNDLWYEFLGI